MPVAWAGLEVSRLFLFRRCNRVCPGSAGANSRPTTDGPAVSFTYTPTGKRASMTDGSGTTTCTYVPQGTVGYGLDPVSNRLSEASSFNEISSVTRGFNADDDVSSESYDQNGNVIAARGKAFGSQIRQTDRQGPDGHPEPASANPHVGDRRVRDR